MAIAIPTELDQLIGVYIIIVIIFVAIFALVPSIYVAANAKKIPDTKTHKGDRWTDFGIAGSVLSTIMIGALGFGFYWYSIKPRVNNTSGFSSNSQTRPPTDTLQSNPETLTAGQQTVTEKTVTMRSAGPPENASPPLKLE